MDSCTCAAALVKNGYTRPSKKAKVDKKMCTCSRRSPTFTSSKVACTATVGPSKRPKSEQDKVHSRVAKEGERVEVKEEGLASEPHVQGDKSRNPKKRKAEVHEFLDTARELFLKQPEAMKTTPSGMKLLEPLLKEMSKSVPDKKDTRPSKPSVLKLYGPMLLGEEEAPPRVYSPVIPVFSGMHPALIPSFAPFWGQMPLPLQFPYQIAQCYFNQKCGYVPYSTPFQEKKEDTRPDGFMHELVSKFLEFDEILSEKDNKKTVEVK